MKNLEIGWLSPTGEFVPCGAYEHIEVAKKLVDKYHYNDIEFRGAADDCLWANGWIHIGRSVFTHQFRIGWSYKKYLTDYQKNFLKDYFEHPENVDKMDLEHWKEENGEYEYDEDGFRI